MKIIIIGAGLIGSERIKAINTISEKINSNVLISAVFDPNFLLLNEIKQKYNVPIVKSLEGALDTNPDWAFIATPNNVVYDLASKCFARGVNVLLEKPFGRNLDECQKIISLKPNNLKLNVGFNYRFFAGIESAISDVKNGKFGNLISVNLNLCHGNSPGMEKSWKLDPTKCGGCFTDLGVHVLDMITQLSDKPLNIEMVKSWSGFWNTGIDEEVHLLATNSNKTIFNAQVSLNRWRSNFCLEINGTEGYGVVNGRGRSYGPQSYKTGVRWGWSTTNKSQAETENIVIDKHDCNDSFIKETISILRINNQTNQYQSSMTACDHVNGENIMRLLNDCQYKI